MAFTTSLGRICGPVCLLSVLTLLGLFGWTGEAQARSCHTEVIEAERTHRIPRGILLSIAMVESSMRGTPQAYALNLSGRSVYAESAHDAARYFVDGNGRLRRNVFVGCLQISLTYHHKQFGSLHRMADPADNAAYAARYLKRHYHTYGNWTDAIERYNGGPRQMRRAYVCKVWNYLRSFDQRSARLIDTSHCGPMGQPTIAPRTRQDFLAAQVAARPE